MSGRRVASLVLFACGLSAAASGLRSVRPGEQVVVRRFGRVIEPAWGPGLHWGWPLGFDRFERVRTDQVRRLNVGMDESASDPAEGEFLTGDLNVMKVAAVVQYRIASPAAWALRSVEIEGLLERFASSGLTAALTRRGIDAALREDRPRVGFEVARELNEASRRHGLGVEVLSVSLTEARPPAEVASEFAAAQGGESLRDRRRYEARTRAESTVAAATARAGPLVEASRTEAQRMLLDARARAQRFLALLEPARRDRALTRKRLYLDAMRTLLGGLRRSIILPPDGGVDLTVLGVED